MNNGQIARKSHLKKLNVRHSQRALRPVTVGNTKLPKNCQEQTKPAQECKAVLTYC